MESDSQRLDPSPSRSGSRADPHAATARRPPARPAGQHFATTRWSLVLRASSTDGQRALSELCRAYWAPVHAFLRSYGLSQEDADDVTQSLFTSLLADNRLARADPKRGRFRSWLRSCARNYLFNWLAQRRALKNGGGAAHVSVEAQHEAALPDALIDAHHAERAYDRRWALTVIERAIEQARGRYQRTHREALFDALYAGLSGSASEQNDSEFALALGKSVSAIRVERHRLRACFQECLKREVAETVASPDEVDDELRRLYEALS